MIWIGLRLIGAAEALARLLHRAGFYYARVRPIR